MPSPKRYRFWAKGYCAEVVHEVHKTGRYVLYDDYAALEKERDLLLNEVRNRHSCDGEYVCSCHFCREGNSD